MGLWEKKIKKMWNFLEKSEEKMEKIGNLIE